MRRLFNSVNAVRKLLLHGAQPGDFSKDIFIIETSKKATFDDIHRAERKMGETSAILQVAEETGRLLYRVYDSGDRIKFNTIMDFLHQHGIELNLDPILSEVKGGPPPIYLMVDQGPSKIEIVTD